jgi:hypothetical protein
VQICVANSGLVMADVARAVARGEVEGIRGNRGNCGLAGDELKGEAGDGLKGDGLGVGRSVRSLGMAIGVDWTDDWIGLD